MRTGMRARAAVVALGLAASGVVVATSSPAQAATPSCWTGVTGVASNGKLVERTVHGTKVTETKTSATAFPVPAESIVFLRSTQISGGYTQHLHVYVPGRRPAIVDVTSLDASPNLTATVAGHYKSAFGGRHIADSGSYYAYGLDASGNLKRWTRFQDGGGNLYFGAPRIVARGQGGLKTLSYQWSFKKDGVWRDVLYGTTRAGALKQFQVRWNAPAKPKITVLRKTGFANVTGLSMSACGSSASYASLIAIDRTHNRARWYTLRSSFTPKSSNLVNRGLVAPGADWRLHATT